LLKLQISLIGAVLIGTSFTFMPLSFGLDHSITTEDLDEKEYLTRPTFGLSHENGKKIVDNGFKLNTETFSIHNNHHTPFSEQIINLGEMTSFETRVFSEKGIRVQEFLFGVPEVGKAHMAELGVEVWINSEGEIENVKAIQKSNVIDEDNIISTHEKVKCKSSSREKICDSTQISIKFLEPLEDKVMAIKAIDWKNRYQITYLNHGIDVSGDSLNPLPTALISSPKQKEGPIEITQSKKYSVLWVSEDGRVFERNRFGSFNQIIDSFDRFEDSGNPRTRVHSGFDSIIKYEQEKAVDVFNATSLKSELPEIFSYTFPEPEERITEEIKQIMIEQETIAKKIIEESSIQARFSNTIP